MIKSRYVRLLIYSYLPHKEVFTKVSKISRTERQGLLNSQLLIKCSRDRPLKLFINEKTYPSFIKELEIGIRYLTNICSSLVLYVSTFR
jgi:hypothetical protein